MSGSPLRHRIGQREPIGLFWMTLGSSIGLEVAAQAKPDAIVIDAQHGLWDRTSLEQSVGVVVEQPRRCWCGWPRIRRLRSARHSMPAPKASSCR